MVALLSGESSKVLGPLSPTPGIIVNLMLTPYSAAKIHFLINMNKYISKVTRHHGSNFLYHSKLAVCRRNSKRSY